MDNDSASDQRQKELSISLAASSMINSSDMINQEAYQVNLKRIQEAKEMVRRLEMNNEIAHKNYLVDQLEKRAKDGREAEIMLSRLRNHPELPETVQFTNNASRDNAEVVLPTTATLVEVPESHSTSYSSPAPIIAPPSQTTQQASPVEYQWSTTTQVHQIQSYNPGVFPYYMLPSTAPPQHSAAPLSSQAPINGQMGWYTTQNVPPQTGVHHPPVHKSGFQSPQVQQPTQSWATYPHPAISPPAADTVPAPGNYAAPSGWIRTAPAQDTGSSSMTYREPDIPARSTASALLVTAHNQPQNLPSLTSTSRVQVPLRSVAASSVNVPSSQLPTTRSHLQPAESQYQPISVPASVPIAISEFQRSYKPPQQPQYHQQQPRSRPQQLPQQSQPQCYSQDLPTQRPLQPPQTHLQGPPQSADRVPFAVSQAHSQPSEIPNSLPVKASSGISQTQPSHPTIVQEQARQQGAQSRADQAMFIRLFQAAVQRGVLQLKAFLLQARASGISDEWFRAAINSVPRHVWESVVAQDSQSSPTLDVPSPVNVSRQEVSTIPGPNVPVVSARSSAPATALVQTIPSVQLAAKPSASAEGRITLSAPGQAPGSYAVQMQYYAEQATKSLSDQVPCISATSPGNIPSTPKTVATPTRDVPQTQANVRTPKDANKSTLARDILRSLGKIVPKPCQEMGGEPTDKANNVNPTQPVSHMAVPAAPKPSVVPPATSFIRVNSPSVPSAGPDVQAEPQQIASPNLPTAKPTLQEESGQVAVISGPIMIDLTLDDSDESDDRKRREPTSFPIQTSASTAASSQPISPTNTTTHTPLLENLSLEERPIDIVADDDDANVRMYNPLFSMPTEENVESELLYPPLGVVELASPSSEPLPREASEHQLDGQLPLFLPSPPVSPANTEPPETDIEMINDEGKSKLFLKRRSADVDETPRVRKRWKQQVYVLIPPAPLYVRKAIKKMNERAMGKDIESESEGVVDDEELQYSHLEQLLIEESKSRLLERRCRWLNCGAILNCAANLLVHLKNHANEEDSEAPFLCRWTSCQREFGIGQERDVHLERHTIRPLPCPFAGCDERFNKPVEVMQHEVQHRQAEPTESLTRKTTCRPVVPAIPARLGQPPDWLPSHRVIPRRVVKCRISADRHATMGPWVLWNIFSPVDFHTRKQNATMRGRPTRQAIDYERDGSDPRRDDYDFLLAHSPYPAKNAQLDDLDSSLVTMSAARGLTLWGSDSTINGGGGSATPEGWEDVAEGEGKSDGSGENSRPESAVMMGEEDAVERMLIL